MRRGRGCFYSYADTSAHSGSSSFAKPYSDLFADSHTFTDYCPNANPDSDASAYSLANADSDASAYTNAAHTGKSVNFSNVYFANRPISYDQSGSIIR